MQWKIPFQDYFKSESSRLEEAAAKYTDTPTRSPSDRPVLSQAQLNVIAKFPSPRDHFSTNMATFMDLIDTWKDKKQIWPLAYNFHMFAATNVLSAAIITNGLRRSFNLADGRTALLNSYVPATLVPLFFGTVLHYNFITGPIAAGSDQNCEICRGVRAGLIQATTASLYPVIYGLIANIYFADYFNTYPTPESVRDQSSRQYIYDVLKKAFRRNTTRITSLAIINFLFAFYITGEEPKYVEFMYFSLLAQEYKRLNKVK